MSKAFVIKNKEGKFFQWLFNHEPDWEDKLYNGFMHYSKEDAKKSIIQWQLKDCEVVEITIAEGDLEQQLDKAEQELAFYQDEIKNRGTCGLCEKLENKQIKELKEQLAIIKRALLKASKEAFGNKISFVSSNYSKKITNSEEYAEYLIFEIESEVINGN